MQFGRGAPAKPQAPPAFAYGLAGGNNVLGEFDPANFLEGKTELEVFRYREAELAHGRVSMLASLGFIVQEKFHPLFSGDGGPAIDQIPQLPPALWIALTIGIGAAEFYRIRKGWAPLDETGKAETALREGYMPGDLAFDPLGLAPEDGGVRHHSGEGALALQAGDDRGLGLPRAGGRLGRHLGHLVGRRHFLGIPPTASDPGLPPLPARAPASMTAPRVPSSPLRVRNGSAVELFFSA